MSDLRDKVIETGYELRTSLLTAIEIPSNREGVSIELLKVMLASLEKILDRIDANDVCKDSSKNMLLTRIIVDSWPMGTRLGKDITEWEILYVNS